MNFKLSRLGALAISLGAAQAAMAGVPDFSAWTLLGDVSQLADQRVVLTTAAFAFDDDGLGNGALNLSGRETVDAGFELPTFVGVAPTSLDLDIATMASEGSAMSRSFTVGVGDRISFDWQLATREGTTGLDYAFVVIDGQRLDLGNAGQASQTAGSPWLSQTGLLHFEYTFQRAGAVNVAFGIVDVLDYGTSSALYLNNLAVTAVPEPTSYALMLAGSGLLFAVARRRQRNG